MQDRKVIEKVFESRDVFYNNGIVNFYEYLKENKQDNFEYVWENNALKISFEEEHEEDIFDTFLEDFINNNDIVYQTDNYRWYWDDVLNRFVSDRRFDVKGRASGNDVKHGVYKYIYSNELDISKERLCDMFEEFIKENNIRDKAFADFLNKLKTEDKVQLVLHGTKNEAVANFARYFADGAVLGMDSKIHQFEDGQSYFRDMLPNKKGTINRWSALIYWYGSRIKRFFNSDYYMYPNSYHLEALYKIKSRIGIKDDSFSYTDKDTGMQKKLPTNIDINGQLANDGINNKNFYISKSEQEFELKFFMYLFSFIYHIEDDYMNNTRKDIRKIGRKEELYNCVQKLTFVTYTEDGDMKSGLNEYSKAYELIQFFEQLKTYEIEDEYSNLFTYLSQLITSISLSKSQKELNLNIKSFADNLLHFRSLRKNCFQASYDILKNDSHRLGKELFYFERLYLNKINRGEEYMNLHEKAHILGDGIGKFASDLGNKGKDLLFGLRNVKNHKQLVTYFKDLKYEALKAEDTGFTKEFLETLPYVLEELDKKQDNWEIVRDYIAIYAIDKYKFVTYAKLKGGSK